MGLSRRKFTREFKLAEFEGTLTAPQASRSELPVAAAIAGVRA